MKKKRTFKISLILEAFQNLERAYVDLKKNLSLSEEEFTSNKLVLDRVRIDFNLAFESCMRVCRHLSAVMGVKTGSKDCLPKIGEAVGMEESGKLSAFTEFYFKYRDLKDAVSPRELYYFLKENLYLFKEFARSVVEYIKNTTGNHLLIDFDLLKEKAKHIKDSVKKIEFVLSQGAQEFKQKPMYYDRTKYFYQVAYDSLYDICTHLAPKFGIKKFGDDCLTKMVEAGIISQDLYMPIFRMTNLKNKLISTWDVPPDELYRELKELTPHFPLILKEISAKLSSLLEEYNRERQSQG
jgi:uncharacterized protein YutE (UPF0331/DUF86 family)